MSTAPSDEELFALLSATERPSRIIDSPRKDPVTGEPLGQFRICTLSTAELMVAQTSAERFVREMLKSNEGRGTGYEQLYSNALSIELLARSIRKIADPKSVFFPTSKHIRDVFSIDEIAVLVNAYNILQAELGPIVASMTTTEVDAWIERLGRGGSAVPLSVLSSEALTALTMHLASRLHSSPTAITSSGELAESGPDEAVDAEPL